MHNESGSPRPVRGGKRRFTALLFDLDGTLLDVHMPSLLKAYFQMLAPLFGAEQDLPRFREGMIASVRMMLRNRDGTRLLSEIFLDAFAPRVGMEREKVRNILRVFHQGEFARLRHLTRPFPEAAPLLKKALSLGYDIALATNPVFFPEAIEARAGWAGLEHVPFRFVSTAENMHFTKPHPEYFTEVLGCLGRKPAECVMIGNDPAKDLPAGRVGITTFYFASSRERDRKVQADHSGSLNDFGRWLDRVTGPTAPA